MRLFTIFLFLIILSLASSVYGQSTTVKKGDKYYLKGEYYLALVEYKKAKDAGEQLDNRTMINMAMCMYHQNDIQGAFDILIERVDQLEGDEIFFYAMTAQKVKFYDDAIKYYNKAKAAGYNPAVIDELIASCEWANANDRMNTSILVNPETELYTGGQSFGIQFYKDGVVYSSADESSGNKTLDKQGREILNLYISDVKDGRVQPGKRIFSKNLIFPTHVGAISFTSDLSMMYYSRVVRAKGDSFVKIFSVQWDGKDWVNETELSINGDNYSCGHPAVSPDGKFLIFSSNRSGGYGAEDLYYVERSKDGKLGEVKNLGSEINTFGKEQFPFISKDNTLYYSSDGRKGFGGLDIFSAKFVNGKWTSITNMMQPINSNMDDFGYTIDPNNSSQGFLSSNRLGSGDNDVIFSIILSPSVDKKDSIPTTPIVEEPKVEAPIVPAVVAPTVVESSLPSEISTIITSTLNGTPINGVKVSIKDLTTGVVVGTVYSDKSGNFVFSIPEGSRVDGREFELTFSKGDEFNAKTMIVNIQEIEDLKKNGLSLTPIFKDAVLDDISGMVIPYVGTTITPEGMKTIDALAAYLLQNPNLVIKLNGHTDARGDKLNNLRVSQTMSEKAKNLLVQRGIPSESIIARSYGERYILNSCKRGAKCDEADHLKNRRIDIVIWRIKK